MTAPYEIYAIRYAKLHSHRSELYYRYSSYGVPDAEVEMAYYFWVLRRDDETIVVDTGFDPVVGTARGRTCLVPPTEALSRIGIEPSTVATVIVTHLHYDHIGNLDAFPHAQLIVPEAELEFWTGPLATRFQFGAHVETREIAVVEEAQVEGRVRMTSGMEEILDGITAIEVGGHSPGQQLTLVEGATGRVVLASDAVHFSEELELQRPFAVMHDLERMYAAYDTLDELAAGGAIIVPGHDPDVARRYPAIDDDTDGTIVRIA